MTVCDLFAGIGGFSLGLQRAGMTIKYQVEIDPYAIRVLEKHWPNVTRFTDIRQLQPEEIGPVDLVCGGAPCQPTSIAGKRRGQEDDRWLWPEMLRIIQGVRPAWVLGENVTGIISLGLDGVLSDLEGAGYACQAFIIPACAVDAPHRRDRVWIVAHANSERHTAMRGQRADIASQSPIGTSLGRRSSSNAEREITNASPREDTSNVAHANGERQLQPQGCKPEQRGWIGDSGQDVPDASQPGLPQPERQAILREGWRQEGGATTEFCRWPTEPGVGRVAHGIPRRVDRLKALGNSVVPAVVERIGKAIMESSKCAK